MKKILILGNCGVGKTTFSRKLAKKLSLPLIHLDLLYWQPNWTKPSLQAWRETVTTLVAGEKWIIEGNYRNSLDLRVPASDTVIFLDFPKSLAMWRALTRFFQSMGRNRPEIGGENLEKIDWQFLQWIATYPRDQIVAEIMKYRENQHIIIIKSPKELESFLQNEG